MARVRIVVPVYNRGAIAKDAVASIREQTWSDWEAILLDDGSTDDTPQALAAIAAQDRRIRVVLAPHGGAGRARNRAMSEAGSYRFIAFLDCDDRWFREHLEHSVAELEASAHVDLCFARCRIADPLGICSEAFFRARYEAEEAFRNASEKVGEHGYLLDRAQVFDGFVHDRFCPTTSTVVARREVLPGEAVFDEHLYANEDLDLYTRLAYRKKQFLFLDALHCERRILGDNLSYDADFTAPATEPQQRSMLRYLEDLEARTQSSEQLAALRGRMARHHLKLGLWYSHRGHARRARRHYRSSWLRKPSTRAAKHVAASLLPFELYRRLLGSYASGQE